MGLGYGRALDTAAILAGGMGTRLRPVCADAPKVLATVQGRPFITILFDQLAVTGITRVVLLTGYRASDVYRDLGNRYGGIDLEYSVEPSPLGTGGAIRHGLEMLRADRFLLLNGDSFCEMDLAALAQAHKHHGAELTMTLTHVRDAGRFGRVKLAQDGRVISFAEKASNGPGWINAGVYVVTRSLVEQIPDGRVCSLERDLLPAWARSQRVYGFKVSGRFLDIGTPATYASAAGFSFNPEPTATADVTSSAISAVAVGSGLNDEETSHAPA